MRAAQTTLRRPGLPMLRPAVERPHREHTPQTESGAALAFGVIFLAGYLPGIWLGRSGTTPLGQQLAAYYTSRPKGTSLAAAFGAQLAVSLLQLILVLLCGFCVWGVGLLALLFAARGLFLGLCAASVAAQSGASALLRYRLDTLLSDVGTLLLCLWLAGWAVRLAMELFRAVRGRGHSAAAGSPFCRGAGAVSGFRCRRGCLHRHRDRGRRVLTAFAPRISGWPAGRRLQPFSAAHG